MQKLELEFDGLTPQAVVELINMGMAKAEYVDGKVVIRPVDLRKDEKIVEHVRLVPAEKFTDYLVELDGFDDKLAERVFNHSAEHMGFIYPVIAIPNIKGGYTVIDGKKRVELAKEKNMPVPAIIRNYNEGVAFAVAFVANVARRNLSIEEMHKIIKQIIKKNYHGLFKDLTGMKLTEIYAIFRYEKYKDIIEKLKYRPVSVTIEVGRIAIRDKEKAKQVAEEVVRKDIDDPEKVEKIKEKVSRMKSGLYCALCGGYLTKENKNWIAVCSSCKWTLYEELKQVILEKKIKCFVTGKRFYGDEIITVSKNIFKKILQDIPEEVRVSHNWQGVLERLEG